MTEHASLTPTFQYLYFVCPYGTADNSISSICSIGKFQFTAKTDDTALGLCVRSI